MGGFSGRVGIADTALHEGALETRHGHVAEEPQPPIVALIESEPDDAALGSLARRGNTGAPGAYDVQHPGASLGPSISAGPDAELDLKRGSKREQASRAGPCPVAGNSSRKRGGIGQGAWIRAWVLLDLGGSPDPQLGLHGAARTQVLGFGDTTLGGSGKGGANAREGTVAFAAAIDRLEVRTKRQVGIKPASA